MAELFRILGSGEWGTAVAHHLSQQDKLIEVYGRDSVKIKKLQQSKSDTNIEFKNLQDLSSSTNNNVINIIAASSSGFSSLIKENLTYLKEFESITWLTKGIDHNKGLMLHEIVDKEIGNDCLKCIISGPSFAKDIIARKSLVVSIASNNNNLTQTLKSNLETDTFKLIPTKDIIGVEISGIIKNISAILAGSLTANNYTDEYIQKLIELSQDEIFRITSKINCREEYKVNKNEIIKTLSSPACLGDMLLTCYKDHSRNRTLGLNLTNKFDLKHILKDVGTVEGYLSTRTLYDNREKFKIGKIVNTAYDILYNHNDPKLCLEKLFN
tara:strand:- start:2734 stop:3711 length:978 start_codon:yes stop_codon:yes gene_type:complete